jgi:hypothetical protein
LAAGFAILELPMPNNQGPTDHLLRRFLDKALFELRADQALQPYQTVRSPFLEGKRLYENTFFRLVPPP